MPGGRRRTTDASIEAPADRDGLVQQPGLADPGGAFDDHDAAATGAQRGERVAEGAALLVAPAERAGGTLAVVDVTGGNLPGCRSTGAVARRQSRPSRRRESNHRPPAVATP